MKNKEVTLYQYLSSLRDSYEAQAALCAGTPDWERCLSQTALIDSVIDGLTVADAIRAL